MADQKDRQDIFVHNENTVKIMRLQGLSVFEQF